MKRKLTQLLVCPECKADLELHIFSTAGGDRINDGYLRCAACDKGFMIVAGIPRMLPEKLYRNDAFRQKYKARLQQIHQEKHRKTPSRPPDVLIRHQANTIESFGWEWLNYDRFGWDPETKDELWSVENERERFFANTLFEPQELPNKLMLDGGCGNGRYIAQCLEHGVEVVGVDLSLAVETAQRNLKDHPQAHFVQGDLFRLPFRPQTFDLVFSIGVLMHTGDPKRAFRSLSGGVKKGGSIGISVYQKQNPLHEFNDKWIRAFTTRFPKPFLRDVSRLLARAARAAWKVRMLGLINAFMRLEPYELCVFDWYNAPIATHHTYKEVRGWFRQAQAQQIRENKKTDTRDRLRKWIWPPCGFTMRGNM